MIILNLIFKFVCFLRNIIVVPYNRSKDKKNFRIKDTNLYVDDIGITRFIDTDHKAFIYFDQCKNMCVKDLKTDKIFYYNNLSQNNNDCDDEFIHINDCEPRNLDGDKYIHKKTGKICVIRKLKYRYYYIDVDTLDIVKETQKSQNVFKNTQEDTSYYLKRLKDNPNFYWTRSYEFWR